MSSRYTVNVLKNDGATIVSLANAYFVEFAQPKLTLRLSADSADILSRLRRHMTDKEIIEFQLERRADVFWVSPPFAARVVVADQKTLEFDLELLDPVDLSSLS